MIGGVGNEEERHKYTLPSPVWQDIGDDSCPCLPTSTVKEIVPVLQVWAVINLPDQEVDALPANCQPITEGDPVMQPLVDDIFHGWTRQIHNPSLSE